MKSLILNEDNIQLAFYVFKSMEGEKFDKEVMLLHGLGVINGIENICDKIEKYVSHDKYNSNSDTIVTLNKANFVDSNRRIELEFDNGDKEDIAIDLGSILDDKNYIELRNIGDCITIILRQWNYARIVKLYKVE